MRNLFLVYFVNIYMFRAFLGPSSGGTTVCIQQLVLIPVINQPDAQNFCFTISLFHAATCFEHMCSKHVEA